MASKEESGGFTIAGGASRAKDVPLPPQGPPELPCWVGSVRILVKRRGVEASELASSQ